MLEKMGFFDKIVKVVDLISKASEQIENAVESQKLAESKNSVEKHNTMENQQTNKLEDIVILPLYHTVEEEEFAESYSEIRIK